MLGVVLGFGRSWVVWRPLDCCRSLLHILLLQFGLHLIIVNLRLGGAFRKSGVSSIGQGRESNVESRHLQVDSPHLCRLWINGFPPPHSKYWIYWSHSRDIGPVNWCSLFINKCLPFITASMNVRGEKLGGGPVDQSADVLRIVTGALFLRKSRARPPLLG
jgi:hypothetical protein